ncbi:kelch repeat-containing protein [Streptomyces sp. NPDC048349]|uniref:Kelch repeat-containing protein n=1 Tax=Streptomyces sp. NPDC048349 TaxID=3155486 RepID=UPI00341A209B
MYAIGGHNGSPTLDTVEAYSPATNTWRTLPGLPTARYALRATTAPCPKDLEGLRGTCVYAIGGFTGAEWPDPAFDVGTVEAYSPATNTWRTLPSLPTPRSFPAATTAPCPRGVDGLKGSTCVYAIGGAFSDTVEAYSPATNTWRTLPSLGTPRDAPAAATAPCPEGVDGLKGSSCVYAIGGASAIGSILDTVEAYSPATNTWHTAAPLGSPRVALGATAGPCPKGDRGPKQSCVYAIAGFTDFTDIATGSAEVLNPAVNTWSALPALATPRFELGTATAPCPKDSRGLTRTCVYAFGGAGDPPFPILGSVEALPVGG